MITWCIKDYNNKGDDMPLKKGSNIQSSMERGNVIDYNLVDNFNPQNGEKHRAGMAKNAIDTKNIEKSSVGNKPGPITRNL